MADGPIFICGTGRSGTTLFHSMLRQHGRLYSMQSESRFLVAPGGLLEARKEILSLRSLRKFRELMLGEWFRKRYRVDTPREYEGGFFRDFEEHEVAECLDDFAERLRAGVDDAVRTLMTDLFSLGMRKADKARWVEKTPRNVIYLRELHELFPAAQFIHVVRDGRDVAVSILENFWPIGEIPSMGVSFRREPRTVQNAARYWRDVLQSGLAAAVGLPEKTLLEIRFEDVIRNPRRTLNEVCDFLGETFDERMLSFELDAGRLHRWREVFTPDDRATFKAEAQDMLVAYGYERDGAW